MPASVPEEERWSEERGSSSSDGSSRGLSPEGSSLKRAAINGEAAGDRRMAARRRKGRAAAMGAVAKCHRAAGTVFRRRLVKESAVFVGSGRAPILQRSCEGCRSPSADDGSDRCRSINLDFRRPEESQEAQNRSIPANELSIIKEAMKKNWGIDEPRLFQVRAIYEGSFNDGSVIRVWA